MSVIDPWYTSLSDPSWFLGNQYCRNTGFSWCIDSTLYKTRDISWKASASDSKPELLFRSFDQQIESVRAY